MPEFPCPCMLTQCSYHRLLSNPQTWSIAPALLSRTHGSLPRSPHLPLALKMKIKEGRRVRRFPLYERRIDRYARQTFTDALHAILMLKGVHGLTDREDTYISVRELLSHQHFRMLSFPSLQKVVDDDRLHRFELLYQPLKGKDGDLWWIRVKKWQEKDTRLDRIIYSDNVGLAIYATTLQAWSSSISLQGISRLNDKYIGLSRHVPAHNYLTSTAPMSTQVLIYIDVKHAIDMGIQFFVSSRPSPFFAPPMPSLYTPTFGREASSLAPDSSATESNPPSPTTLQDRQFQPPPRTKSPTTTTYKNRSTQILTPGNEFGFLPLECFTKVEVIRVKRKVLWPFDEQDKKEESAILGSDMKSAKHVTTVNTRPRRGYWTENVEVIERDLDQFFVDLPDDSRTSEVHPDLRKEALAIFSA